jgi:hypothetical protein
VGTTSKGAGPKTVFRWTRHGRAVSRMLFSHDVRQRDSKEVGAFACSAKKRT